MFVLIGQFQCNVAFHPQEYLFFWTGGGGVKKTYPVAIPQKMWDPLFKCYLQRSEKLPKLTINLPMGFCKYV